MTRERKIHVLKSWPGYFAGIRDGSKPYDIRRDNRDYQVNDDIVFQEYNPQDPADKYTGEEQRCRIIRTSRGNSLEEHGLAPGFICLGLVRYDVPPTALLSPTEAVQEPQAPAGKRRKPTAGRLL